MKTQLWMLAALLVPLVTADTRTLLRRSPPVMPHVVLLQRRGDKRKAGSPLSDPGAKRAKVSATQSGPQSTGSSPKSVSQTSGLSSPQSDHQAASSSGPRRQVQRVKSASPRINPPTASNAAGGGASMSANLQQAPQQAAHQSPVAHPANPASSTGRSSSSTSSSSVSSGSWNGRGFTSSQPSSPSSWESQKWGQDSIPTEATAKANGPAVIRTRTGYDGNRQYYEFKDAKDEHVELSDANKVQAAVYARRGGTGEVSTQPNRGDKMRVVVDARKSKIGGSIYYPQRPHWVPDWGAGERIEPGTRRVLHPTEAVEALVHGPGKVKAQAAVTQGGADNSSSGSSVG